MHGVSSCQHGSGISCYSLLSRVIKLSGDKDTTHFPILPGLAWSQFPIWEAWDCLQLDHPLQQGTLESAMTPQCPVVSGLGMGLRTTSLSCMNTQSMLYESS